MPLPKSILCNACKKTYPEGWQRCPYCGFNATGQKLEQHAKRFLDKKIREFEQKTGKTAGGGESRRERGGRPSPPQRGRDQQQPREGRGRDKLRQAGGGRPQQQQSQRTPQQQQRQRPAQERPPQQQQQPREPRGAGRRGGWGHLRLEQGWATPQHSRRAFPVPVQDGRNR
jgi:hypothetical protein